jgi:hypothetical protein
LPSAGLVYRKIVFVCFNSTAGGLELCAMILKGTLAHTSAANIA